MLAAAASSDTTNTKLAKPAYDLLNACLSGACLGVFLYGYVWGGGTQAASIVLPKEDTRSIYPPLSTHKQIQPHTADFVLQVTRRANARSMAQGKRRVTTAMVEGALQVWACV